MPRRLALVPDEDNYDGMVVTRPHCHGRHRVGPLWVADTAKKANERSVIPAAYERVSAQPLCKDHVTPLPYDTPPYIVTPTPVSYTLLSSPHRIVNCPLLEQVAHVG